MAFPLLLVLRTQQGETHRRSLAVAMTESVAMNPMWLGFLPLVILKYP